MATIETEIKLLTVLATATGPLYTKEIQDRAGVATKTITYAMRDFITLEWVTLEARTTGYRYYRITGPGWAHLQRITRRTANGATCG